MHRKNTRKKVLIVDDDTIFIKLLTDALSVENKYDFIVAYNGAEALEKLKEKPDVILLDLIMPQMGGVDFLKKLRSQEDNSEIPVIVITQLSDVQKVAETARYKIKGYIVKSETSLDQIGKKIDEI